jgi:hydrogenase maturation factor HypF (carbamoyltransferase family)
LRNYHDSDVVVCTQVRDDTGLGTVALSGGVLQNVRLIEGCVDRLTRADCTV